MALKIDSVFWIIALSAFVVVLYVLFGLPNVDAISRAEQAELKAQKNMAEQRLIDLEIQLKEQNILINAQDDNIDALKEELRGIQGLNDWESLSP